MKQIIPYIILIVFLGILVGVTIYLSNKFSFILNAENKTPLYVLFGLIPMLFMITSGAFINATGFIGHIAYKIGAVLMGVYLFLFFSFLIADTINLFFTLKPVTYGLLSISLTLLISLYAYFNSTNIRTTKHDIPIAGLNKEIKAVHLTDIHIGHFRTNGFINRIIEKTNQLNPDVIFLTGDYLDSKYALKEEYFEPLKQLNAPVYFIDGNHDHATGNDKIMALMKSVGVNVLENELAWFGDIQIVGLSFMLADENSFDMHASEHSPTIKATLPKIGIDKNKPVILLHHGPNGIKYANEHGVDLYLTGHTHAGQIFPFNYIANLLFEYNRGLHEYKDTKVLVSEGFGTFGPPFRLGTKSEIVSLNLLPNKH